MYLINKLQCLSNQNALLSKFNFELWDPQVLWPRAPGSPTKNYMLLLSSQLEWLYSLLINKKCARLSAVVVYLLVCSLHRKGNSLISLIGGHSWQKIKPFIDQYSTLKYDPYRPSKSSLKMTSIWKKIGLSTFACHSKQNNKSIVILSSNPLTIDFNKFGLWNC